MSVQPFLIGDGWIDVKDGDASVRAIFDRHYSRYVYADGRRPKLFAGPGEKLVLMEARGGAICVWRKFISRDAQQGVNCAVFRREDGEVASGQLLDAMARAWLRWPGERLYTYVDPRGVTPTIRASRPTWGHCFYQAGWRFCGLTKGRLHILEALPLSSAMQTVDAVPGGRSPTEGIDPETAKSSPPNPSDRSPREGRE